MDDGSATSIGQQDQCRDREMLREKRRRDSLKGDADAKRTASGDRPVTSVAGATPAIPGALAADEGDDWHPGDAEQPDRTESPGLTGSGPAQPDP